MKEYEKPRFYSYEEIRSAADEFAEKNSLGQVIPVDVEKLIDNVLKINIVPFPSLYRSFGINAFISSDFHKIYVDEYLYTNLEPQYRFTLAHELGHLVLHRQWYRQFRIESLDSYRRFVTGLGDERYGLLETQANYFAGLFLVPSKHLETKFKEEAKEICRFISSHYKGLKRDKYIGVAVDLIAQKLRSVFNVHHLPIRIRIEKDRLDELIP